MVKEYLIDCSKLGERRAAHRYLAKTLELPEYYGNNLDALYDCLTEMGECSILLKGALKLYESGGYGEKILKVMQDAAAANPRLKIAVAEDETVGSGTEE